MAPAKIGFIVSIYLTFLALFSSPCSGEEIIRHWESLTSLGDVKAMAVYNGDVWTATLGGLVRIDPVTMTYTVYTNVDGLQTNQLYSLCVDDKNRLWVGGRGRLINFSDPNHPDGYLLTDRDGNFVEINDIDCSPGGDSLWLANRLGLTLFIASDIPGDGVILETYTRFGEIERDTPARKPGMKRPLTGASSSGTAA